jgi:hypothetical protein
MQRTRKRDLFNSPPTPHDGGRVRLESFFFIHKLIKKKRFGERAALGFIKKAGKS